MHFAFGRVRRRIALLRAHPFVVGQFIARLLPIYFFKLHQTAPTGPGGSKPASTTVPGKILHNQSVHEW